MALSADLLHGGGELQAQLDDLVLGDCEVADPCQRGPAREQRGGEGRTSGTRHRQQESFQVRSRGLPDPTEALQWTKTMNEKQRWQKFCRWFSTLHGKRIHLIASPEDMRKGGFYYGSILCSAALFPTINMVCSAS